MKYHNTTQADSNPYVSRQGNIQRNLPGISFGKFPLKDKDLMEVFELCPKLDYD